MVWDRFLEGAVRGIYLDSNNLVGDLPPEIGNLENLEWLGLIDNQLTSLPPEIGNLENLLELGLNENQLTSLPPEIGNLSNLGCLGLSNNQLTTLPPEIGNLSILWWFDIVENQLTSLPPEIGNLSDLEWIDLSGNQLISLPPEIGNLENLGCLGLWYNQLTSLPPEIGNLENLSDLWLDENQLISLPPEIGNLSNLDCLGLWNNQLTSLPPEIGNLSNLSCLWLDENQLTSLPPEIGNLWNIEQLYFTQNQLASLPPEIGNLENLLELWLNENQLTSIPIEIGDLSNLGCLGLSNNQLISLPPEIGNLSILWWFDMVENQLTSLPPEIGNLSDLEWLDLSGNQIASLPPEIGNLENLSELRLDNNQLNDPFPLEICTNLIDLEYLYFDKNNLGEGSCEAVHCLIDRGGWDDLEHSPQNNGFTFMDDCPCEDAIAFAGNDATICTGDIFTLDGATAENYETIAWTTDGDGVFDDPASLNAAYTPGVADIANVGVELCLTAYAVDTCVDATDCMNLTIWLPPEFDVQPENVTVQTGEDAVFTVEVSGGGPINLQWYGPEGSIDGATDDELTIEKVNFLNEGDYYCVAENICETVLGQVASLEVVSTGVSQNISLSQGWSGISSYLWMDDPAVEDIFNQYLDELIIMLDGEEMFWPGAGVNTIGLWNNHQGYIIKAAEPFDLTLAGSMENETTLQLPSGWVVMPVICENLLDVEEVFAPFSGNMVIVKEVAGGNIYWPEFGINTLKILEPGKAYFVLMNSEAELTFTPWHCGKPFIDPLDGQAYQTIQIGKQCWMAENLNVGIMINGNEEMTDNSVIEKYCYDNDENNCNIYGGLYQWDELMQYDTSRFLQGICPEGWHIPTLDEWNILVDETGGPPTAGTELKTGGSTGFEALMAGIRDESGVFGGMDNNTYFYNSVNNGDLLAHYQMLAQTSNGVESGFTDRTNGFSLRCLRGLPLLVDTNAVVIDTTVYHLISDSLQLAQGIYIYIVNQPKMKTKDIITDLDIIIGMTSEGYLRRVTEMVQNNDTLSLQTEFADMEDLFQSGEFSFENDLGNTIPDSTKQGRMEVLYLAKGVTFNIADDGGFQYGFSDVELYNNGPVNLSITEGHVKFEPNFIFDFMYQNYTVKKLAFYTEDALLETNIDVALTVSQSVQLIDYEKLLGSYKKVKVYWAGWVPIVIVAKIDLKAISTLNLGASFSATTGYTNTNTLDIGCIYEKGTWEKVFDLDIDHNIHPLELEGMVSLEQDIRLVPEVTFKLYAVAGPYFNTALYENFTGNIVSPSLDWDAKLDIGLTSNIGADITIFGKTLSSYNKEIPGFEYPIWIMPDTLIMVSGNNQTAEINQQLPEAIKVKVIDNYGNTFSYVPVHFEITEGGGSLSEDDVMTDANGFAQTYWVMGDEPGENKLVAKVVKADGTIIPGSPLEFTATATGQIPGVTTEPITDNTMTKATGGGNVTDDGGSAVSARGVCWSTGQNPTLEDNHTTDGSGTGTFTSYLTGLTDSTTYYVRAYATNIEGTAYGNEVSFTTKECPATFTYHGQVYETVLIGDQCWMAENLNVGTFISGNENMEDNGTIEKYCYVNNLANCDTYGGLYQWDETMQYTTTQGVQGICPEGWHIPATAEWSQLAGFLGGSSNAGGKMKEEGTTHWASPNTGATNQSGFTALPGGCRDTYGSFGSLGYHAYFWSSTERYADRSWYRQLYTGSTFLYNYDYLKVGGFSIRCLQD